MKVHSAETPQSRAARSGATNSSALNGKRALAAAEGADEGVRIARHRALDLATALSRARASARLVW